VLIYDEFILDLVVPRSVQGGIWEYPNGSREVQFGSRVHMNPLLGNKFQNVKVWKKIACISGHSMFAHKFIEKRAFLYPL
jgi:hypothetical protein